jgi:nucleotide-binding universal stress UspA family protein
MFRTIVVPLDGSPLAENALPLAISIARRANGSLRLVRVHAPHAALRHGKPCANADVAHQERAYLDEITRKIHETCGVAVTTDLLEEGTIAPALCAHAQALGADLMALTTHGRGPLSRFWLGSITDELLRSAPVPLLVLRPESASPPALDADRRLRNILVPLDGTEGAEAVLPSAAELAKLMHGGLTLLRAVEVLPVASPDGLLYSPTALDATLVEELVAQAHHSLDRVAGRLRAEGLTVGTCVTAAEPVAASILGAAEDADLVALATHGRSKVARFFLGSVADKVVRGAPCPVLVVRTQTAHPTGDKP